jgi:ABC-type uncharacterized transport system permease subunit
LLHGIAAIAAGGDQIVSGMALNLICRGCHTEPRFGMVRAARHDAALAERGALRPDRIAPRPVVE